MKLREFERRGDYRFFLVFENGEAREADLKGLIGQYVDEDSLRTARIDSEWGCLEFLDGRVDIEPKTLYQYVCATEDKQAA